MIKTNELVPLEAQALAHANAMMPPSRYDTGAAERKRLRDRVAQQNLRNKRNRHIQALERQVKLCHELHGSQDNGHLLKTIRDLRVENSELRERQRRLQALFRSCEDVLDQRTCFEGNSLTRPSRPLETSAPRDAEPSNNPREPTPLGSCQDPDPQIKNSDPSLAAPAMAQSHQLPCNDTAEARSDMDHTFWFQENDLGENLNRISSTNSSALDTQLTEFNDSKPLEDSTHIPTSGRNQSMLSRLISPERVERSSDMSNICFTMPHSPTTSLDPIRSSFPVNLDRSVTVLDPSFWDALDPWGIRNIEDSPVWARIPLRVQSSYDIRHSPWDADVRLILEAPDTPSPLDLLFGSKQNQLASIVQRNVKDWYSGDPERLAIGWHVYHYIKWRTQPTVERYSRLPNCLKPASEQTWSPHPGCLDLIVWEKLRLNILKNYYKYDIDKFIRLYCDCLKLRWSKDEEVLVPHEEDKHTVRPDFLKRFMSEDGWGLKVEFLGQYPELFEGLDLQKVVYNGS